MKLLKYEITYGPETFPRIQRFNYMKDVLIFIGNGYHIQKVLKIKKGVHYNMMFYKNKNGDLRLSIK